MQESINQRVFGVGCALLCVVGIFGDTAGAKAIGVVGVVALGLERVMVGGDKHTKPLGPESQLNAVVAPPPPPPKPPKPTKPNRVGVAPAPQTGLVPSWTPTYEAPTTPAQNPVPQAPVQAQAYTSAPTQGIEELFRELGIQ